jgi:peptidoglycan/LPS O-acetylase OafA/YrhL
MDTQSTQVDEARESIDGDLDRAYAEYQNTKIFGALDGIRALCCLVVVKGHAGWVLSAPRSLNHDYLGVDMFFAISGFLIVTLLTRERARKGSINMRNFYARRTLRIFPIYYLMVLGAMAFYLAISPWKPNGWEYYRWTFLALVTYTQDLLILNLGIFFHAWSLAMEEQFYLVWPAAERFLSRNGRWVALGAVICASQIVNFGLLDSWFVRLYDNPAAPKLAMFEVTFTPIALGVALAYLLHDSKTFAVLYRLLGHRYAFVPLVAALLVVLELSPEDLSGLPRLTVQLLFALLLGSLVIRPDHGAMALLKFPPLVQLGVTSYGIYLYHILVLAVVERGAKVAQVTLPPFGTFVVATVLTAAVAQVSFRYIEQPLLRLRARFSD